jgi:hypothetical protein
MINFVVGFVLGFIVATTGFTGFAQMMDSGIDKIKNTSISVDSK